MDFITEYFKIMKINGIAKRLDLIKDLDEVEKLSANVDVTFLFKALDSIETITWGNSEKLLKCINSDWIVVSFATRSIGGKKEIKKEKRKWFDKLCEKEGWQSEIIEFTGEIFYIIKKKLK
jgi:hypothetical protein